MMKVETANENMIIEQTVIYIREQLSGEGTGHDWWHIQRVVNVAEKIAIEENADIFVVRLAALLHDIADHKFHNGDEEIGPKTAGEWMEKIEVSEPVVEHVKEIIKNVSYKGAGVETPMSTIEGKVVQDADRLDALGAIGIARTFAYGGHKGNEFYNPEIKPRLHDSFESYKKSNGTVINHFYEKLLLLKDRMNTQTGKKMAEERHKFMEEYLKQFFGEWEGRW